MDDKSFSRRSFLKLGMVTATTLAAGPVFGLRGVLSNAHAADSLKALTENDPTAKALCYHGNAAKVDAKKPECVKKAAPDGATQKCTVCMFYTSLDAKHGKCQIFPNNTVLANGWCNSWTKKPA